MKGVVVDFFLERVLFLVFVIDCVYLELVIVRLAFGKLSAHH